MAKEIGKVFAYYPKIEVAAIKLSGSLSVGDEIQIKGATTDFKQEVKSMQSEHDSVEKAKKGDSVGIKVKDKVRPNDVIYKE